jgi:glycosyltransferase involved in cell wall biosynthesis
MIDEPIIDEAVVHSHVPGNGDRITLLAAGRLVKQKNFALAIRALGELSDPRLFLTIVGDGPEHESLTQLARSTGVARQVALPGHVADIRRWLARTRLFVLPSIFEGYPAVAIEALAAGVPVIASNCSPAMAEIITSPEFGAIVPGNDQNKFAAAIRYYLDRPPPNAARLAKAADKHRAGAIAERYLALIDSL